MFYVMQDTSKNTKYKNTSARYNFYEMQLLFYVLLEKWLIHTSSFVWKVWFLNGGIDPNFTPNPTPHWTMSKNHTKIYKWDRTNQYELAKSKSYKLPSDCIKKHIHPIH